MRKKAKLKHPIESSQKEKEKVYGQEESVNK